jgi:hypothetical protein
MDRQTTPSQTPRDQVNKKKINKKKIKNNSQQKIEESSQAP